MAAALTPTQQRLLAVLRRDPEPLVFDPAVVEGLVARATAALADFSARLGGESLYVSKGWLTRVHGCEAHHLAPDDFAWKPSTAAGFVAHRAIELALNWRGEPAPADAVDEAIARLADQADSRGAFVAGLSDGDLADLRSRAVDRTTKFLQDFPPLPSSSHPVLESSARWKPPGTIEFAGKADLVVGKPHGDESRLLIIDLKTGGHAPQHRADLRFYALLHTLRQRVPPRRLVTYYLDYTDADVEDVTVGALESALIRTLEGIERHIELVVDGRPPVKKPGRACRWCPLADDCTEGQQFLRGSDADDVED